MKDIVPTILMYALGLPLAYPRMKTPGWEGWAWSIFFGGYIYFAIQIGKIL